MTTLMIMMKKIMMIDSILQIMINFLLHLQLLLDYVALSTPDVDRGPSDPPNVICRIFVDKVEALGLDIDMRTDVTTTVREAITKLSVGGGQGTQLV